MGYKGCKGWCNLRYIKKPFYIVLLFPFMEPNLETVLTILQAKTPWHPVSVFGRDKGYTVKYSPLPSGVPSGFALGNSFRQRVIFDRISLVSSKYGYNVTGSVD